MQKLPHIVIFNPDSYRGDVLGHVGNPAALTPNLDQMVETDAVSFSQAYAQNPVCTPSRCSFMTGWYTHVRGHRTMLHMLQPDEPMLLKTLKEKGYFVWWGGKNDLVAVKDKEDYLNYCDVKYTPEEEDYPKGLLRPASPYESIESEGFYSFYSGRITRGEGENRLYFRDAALVQGAISLIEDPPTDKPLCIFLPLSWPHPPYLAEESLVDAIDKSKLPPRVPHPENVDDFPRIMRRLREKSKLENIPEDFWDEIRATYYAMCATIDRLFGQLVDALKDAGIYDDTAIFFFSDHGDYTGDHSLPEKAHACHQDCLLRVPFVIKPPKGIPIEPGVRDQLVELNDFPATVEDMLGYQAAHPHFGKSLLPLIAGSSEEHRDAVFSEIGRHPGEKQCLNSEIDELPETHIYWPALQVSRENDVNNGYSCMCRTRDHKYVRRLYEKDEFYDMANDPGETNNLIDNPDYRDIITQLQLRMLDFYMATCDVVPYEQDSRKI